MERSPREASVWEGAREVLAASGEAEEDVDPSCTVRGERCPSLPLEEALGWSEELPEGLLTPGGDLFKGDARPSSSSVFFFSYGLNDEVVLGSSLTTRGDLSPGGVLLLEAPFSAPCSEGVFWGTSAPIWEQV